MLLESTNKKNATYRSLRDQLIEEANQMKREMMDEALVDQ
jgi:hypothetical protein